MIKKSFKSITCLIAVAAAAVCAFGAGLAAFADDPSWRFEYNFDSAAELSDFVASIDPADNGSLYTGDSWVTHVVAAENLWAYNGTEKTITTKTDAMPGNDSLGNFVSLLYNGRSLKYFELETKIKHILPPRDWGSAGIAFGVKDFSRQPTYSENPGSGMFFVQGGGEPSFKHSTLTSGAANGIKQLASISDYNAGEWHTHRVKIYEGHYEYYVDDVKLFDETAVAGDVGEGKAGIFVTNREVAFSEIKINPLLANGAVETVGVTSLEITAPPATGTVGTPITVTANVLPADAANKAFELSCAPADGVYTDGGKVLFKEPGTYTVTATSLNNPAANDSFSITVSERSYAGYIPYALTEAGMNKFESVHIAGSDNGVGAPYDELYALSGGTLTRTPDAAASPDEDYGMLYIKDNTFKNFEITFKAKTTSKNGWYGIVFGKQDKNKAGNQEGESVFMQASARAATLWGQKLGGPAETVVSSNAYDAWSLFRFRVYGGGNLTVEMYVDDMVTPVLTKQIATVTGAVGIFASSSETSFKDVYGAVLDDSGAVIPYVAVTGLTIGNKQATATVGDQFNIDALITPETASDKRINYVSGNSNVAIINPSGQVTVLLAGTTEISVTSVDDPSKTDSFVLTTADAAKPVTSIVITNKKTSAKVGDAAFTLTVSVSPLDADDGSVTFTSSNTAVATVDADGKVTIVGAGTAVITAKSVSDPTKTDSFTLEVAKADGCGSVYLPASGIGAGLAAIATLAGAALVLGLRRGKKASARPE
ncbi:MAG: Ig-like domain-containing protein [Clostridiales bacterium]|jgi:uncharacterized protein YjdB|nr:Ig-like domain-containing protein [Clostridiales bacterium]